MRNCGMPCGSRPKARLPSSCFTCKPPPPRTRPRASRPCCSATRRCAPSTRPASGSSSPFGWKKETPPDLAGLLQSHPGWLKNGWRALAEYRASHGDFRGRNRPVPALSSASSDASRPAWIALSEARHRLQDRSRRSRRRPGSVSRRAIPKPHGGGSRRPGKGRARERTAQNTSLYLRAELLARLGRAGGSLEDVRPLLGRRSLIRRLRGSPRRDSTPPRDPPADVAISDQRHYRDSRREDFGRARLPQRSEYDAHRVIHRRGEIAHAQARDRLPWRRSQLPRPCVICLEPVAWRQHPSVHPSRRSCHRRRAASVFPRSAKLSFADRALPRPRPRPPTWRRSAARHFTAAGTISSTSVGAAFTAARTVPAISSSAGAFPSAGQRGPDQARAQSHPYPAGRQPSAAVTYRPAACGLAFTDIAQPLWSTRPGAP